MKPKKILVYSNNEFAVQMFQLLYKKNYDLTIVIEYFSKINCTENN